MNMMIVFDLLKHRPLNNTQFDYRHKIKCLISICLAPYKSSKFVISRVIELQVIKAFLNKLKTGNVKLNKQLI